MNLNDVINWVSETVRQHEAWAIPIVFFLAFGESLAFLSLLLPATVILLGLGALIGESGIAFWPVWAAAAAGAFFGDWLSYWVGYHYQGRVAHMWPLSRNPQLLVRGHAFFERWGVLGIFLGASSGRYAPWCRWWGASVPCRKPRSRLPMWPRQWSGLSASWHLAPLVSNGLPSGWHEPVPCQLASYFNYSASQ